MHRAGWTALASIALAASTAAADATQVGVYFGPRVFSTDSRLGYIEDAPAHPTIQNGVQIGARVARPFFSWLVPELEMTFVPTNTSAVGGAAAADVVWMEPRLHLRFELLPGRRVQPFLLVGGGAPIVLSSARMTLDSGITAEAYAGAGLRYDAERFALRIDARVGAVPGIEYHFTPEIDISVGFELYLGRRAPKAEALPVAMSDRDGDGIPDADDLCPDRPEDIDGFEDDDGCPDIDNDLDRVLDIADRCNMEPETYNGFQDDDGCPDSVPADVDELRGTIEGLLYADGETAVRDSAQPSIEKLAATLNRHPSVKIVLVGHTDDREADQFAIAVDGAEAPDLTTVALDLARARAEAAKQALVAAGVAAPRITVKGAGPEDPVADNETPKGRLANRRVELQIFVAPH